MTEQVANHDADAVTTPGMQVFLVPVGDARYEPYCEICEELHDESPSADERRGWLQSVRRQFHEVLAAAERYRTEPDAPEPGSWTGRLKRRALAYIAERVAEQRLLWHLRTQERVDLVYPADVTEGDAHQVLRRVLRADAERHRRWAVLDGVLMVITGVGLALIPGPNVVGFFFAFRTVGHWLSYRGARQGLDEVTWHASASDALAELRPLMALDPDERQSRVDSVASRLRLQHLARFFERVAFKDA